MNDIFYVIEIYDLTTYADDNILYHIACTTATGLSSLRKDTTSAINLFEDEYLIC